MDLPFLPFPLPLFLITLACSPDLTLVSQGTGFLHIHMSLGNWSHVDELCSRLLCSQNTLLTDTRTTNEWSSIASAKYAMHLKCLSSMIGSSRHSDGRRVGCDYASARDTVEIQQKHWELNGLAWTAPEDIAEDKEWQPLITPKLQDHQDHTTSCSFSKHPDGNDAEDRLKPLRGKIKDKPRTIEDIQVRQLKRIFPNNSERWNQMRRQEITITVNS